MNPETAAWPRDTFVLEIGEEVVIKGRRFRVAALCVASGEPPAFTLVQLPAPSAPASVLVCKCTRPDCPLPHQGGAR